MEGNEHAVIAVATFKNQAVNVRIPFEIPAKSMKNHDITGETKFIGTGIAMEIPEGYAGLIYARSGLSCKRGLAPANKVGVVDADYRGELTVALHNHSNKAETIEPNERIAQVVITPFLSANFNQVDELSDTVRGVGGFGSTGK